MSARRPSFSTSPLTSTLGCALMVGLAACGGSSMTDSSLPSGPEDAGGDVLQEADAQTDADAAPDAPAEADAQDDADAGAGAEAEADAAPDAPAEADAQDDADAGADAEAEADAAPDATEEADAPDEADAAAEAGMDAPAQLCSPGAEYRCVGAELQLCAADGVSWTGVQSCATAGLCNATAGTCTNPACSPGEYSCDASAKLSVCNGAQTAFAEIADCAAQGKVCDAARGRCDTCLAGTTLCQDATTQLVCANDGASYTAITCPAATPLCSSGTCVALPSDGGTDASDAGATDASDAGATDASDAGATDAGDAGATDAGDAGATDASDAGAMDAGDAGATDAGDAGATDAGSSDASDGATCPSTVTTTGVQCSYAYDAYNASASVKTNSTSSWSCSSTTRSLTANGIPDHDVGTFPNSNCPNTIAAWSVSASMTLTPVNTGTSSKIGVVGYAFNGVKFDPSTAGTCTVSGGTTSCSLIGNTGSWNIEALGQTSFDFGVDSSNAHVQPTGEYHYHGMPEGILTNEGKGQAMTLVGFALDGFPVYARYGYTVATNAASAIKVVKGSYQVKSTPDSGRPSTSTYPMGAFTQDYQYVAGSGDLDECNGRTGVTPEFPCGIYHYYITDTYPFIQRCVKGTATGGGGPPVDGGASDAGTDASTCGTCATNNVCCTTGMCAGRCVPDCRVGTMGCPTGLTCNSSTGVCQ